MDSGPTASRRDPERQPDGGDAVARRRLDSAHCAGELLAIVAYITSSDGPLQALTKPGGAVSPWHQRLLLKAAERVDVIDAYLRGRVAFCWPARTEAITRLKANWTSPAWCSTRAVPRRASSRPCWTLACPAGASSRR